MMMFEWPSERFFLSCAFDFDNSVVGGCVLRSCDSVIRHIRVFSILLVLLP